MMLHHANRSWRQGFALLCAAAVVSSAAAQIVYDPEISVEHVAAGLGNTIGTLTTSFCFVDHDTILAVKRSNGQVVRIDLPTPGGPPVQPGAIVLDLDTITAGNDGQSEYGVQGIEPHPDFAQNHWVYLRYDRSPMPGVDTAQSAVNFGPNFGGSAPTINAIERFIWNPVANGGNGALEFECEIRTVVMDTRYHHGSPMVFMQDGTLATGYGDLRRTPGHKDWIDETAGYLRSANYRPGVIENLAIVARMNDDGSIPADNPFADQPEYALWYGYGYRNGFGLDVDPVSGALWTTENSENDFDEINRVFPGHNSGWSWVAGPLDHPQQSGDIDFITNLPGSAYSDPEFSWYNTVGPTAAHFLHGSSLGAAHDDVVLIGGYNVGHLWGFTLNAARDAFALDHPGLQDRVDDRENARGPLLGTEAAETAFGEAFGDMFRGILAIERAPDQSVFILTSFGDLFRLSGAACAGDYDGNHAVNVFDLLELLSHWGQMDPAIDLTGDGIVDLFDLLTLLQSWGGC